MFRAAARTYKVSSQKPTPKRANNAIFHAPVCVCVCLCLCKQIRNGRKHKRKRAHKHQEKQRTNTCDEGMGNERKKGEGDKASMVVSCTFDRLVLPSRRRPPRKPKTVRVLPLLLTESCFLRRLCECGLLSSFPSSIENARATNSTRLTDLSFSVRSSSFLFPPACLLP